MNMQILVHFRLFLYVKKSEVIYFDSFGVEHVKTQKETYLEHKQTIQ